LGTARNLFLGARPASDSLDFGRPDRRLKQARFFSCSHSVVLRGAALAALLLKRVLWCLSVSTAVALWPAGVVRACNRCVELGTTAFHDEFHPFHRGDSFDDTTVPRSPVDEDLATAAFALQGGKFPQPNGPGSPITITYSFNNLLDGGLRDINGVSLPANLIRESVNEALGVWAAHAPLNFLEVADEGGGPFQSDYPNGQFGQIRFSHVFINGPDIPGDPPIAKAMARFPSAIGNIASDVFFDNGDPWQEFGIIDRPDILGAAIHEIGHTLGLAHTGDATANMYWIFRRFSGRGTGQLFADDIAGIQAIYGAGVGSVTTLSVPEPTSVVLCGLLAAILLLNRRRDLR
jgi:hypothetical protein